MPLSSIVVEECAAPGGKVMKQQQSKWRTQQNSVILVKISRHRRVIFEIPFVLVQILYMDMTPCRWKQNCWHSGDACCRSSQPSLVFSPTCWPRTLSSVHWLVASPSSADIRGFPESRHSAYICKVPLLSNSSHIRTKPPWNPGVFKEVFLTVN
jgi:hypothetical protein